MPHFRKLHTKTLSSLDFDALPDDFTRLTWTLLPLIACKEGRGMMHLSWLRSQLYPLRPDVTDEMISHAMQSLIGLDMVMIYSVQGRDYFQIVNWHEYQSTAREGASPYPGPENTEENSNSGLTHEQVVTNSGVGKANSARTSSISISNSISNSTSKSKGGVGGNAKDAIVRELCVVCVNAYPTDRATLELADDLLEQDRSAIWVAEWGEWFGKLDNGKPFLKHIQTFGGHFDRKETPHFAKKKEQRAESAEDEIRRILGGQNAMVN